MIADVIKGTIRVLLNGNSPNLIDGKIVVIKYHKEKDLSYVSNDPWVQQSVCGMTYLHCIQWLK